MHIPPHHEPNPRRENVLRPRYFDEWALYHEDLVCPGRGYGLLPVGAKRFQPLAVQDPPDVLKLAAIHALGVRGHLISVEPDDIDCAIRPLDVRVLPVGRYRVYACLTWEKTPCGDLVDEPPNSGSSTPGRQRWLRKSRVLLALDDDRLEHRDWLPVAEIERQRSSGLVRTYLDPRFHPPITDMRTWCRRNPLAEFAERSLLALDESPKDGGESLTAAAKVELRLLLNIAELGSAETAFLQAQRAIALLRETRRCPPQLEADLLHFRYSPEEFTRFLARLEVSLEDHHPSELYPERIQIDGIAYSRLVGELAEDGEFWVWRTPRSGFNLNGLAIYLPWAESGAIPHVRYGRLRTEPNFDVARVVSPFGAPGVAIVLENVPKTPDTIYLTADVKDLLRRLHLELGEGHAIYHY